MGAGSQPRPHGRTDAKVGPRSAAPLKDKSRTGAKSKPLSSHEFSVLVLVRSGLTTKELAAQLGISINTAKYHLTNIYRKLGAKNRVEASNAYDQLLERSSSARVRTILEWGTRLAANIASPIPRSRAAYVLIEGGMAIPIIEIDSLSVSSGRQFPLAENHHFSEIVSSRQPRVSMVGTRPLGPIAHSSVAAIAVTAGAGVPIVIGDSVHGVLAIGVRGTELPIEAFRRLVDLGRLVELALANATRKSR
jgi:DNA-binding CsgD family transcriptional regulator